MSATNKTTHYELPVFLGSDKPAWLVDWNGAMGDIDSAIYEAKTTADSASTGITTVAADLATLSGTVSSQGGDISTLSTSLTTLIGTVNTITSLIGNGEPTTEDKTIIGAINEINAKIPAGGSVAAENVTFDNTDTSLISTNVQEAIEEVAAALPDATGYAVWIGDSYVQANSLGADQNKRFATLVSQRLGLTEKNYAVGGMGFVTGATPYITQVQNAITNFTNNNYDKSKVKYFFIGGNRNDGPVSGTTAGTQYIETVQSVLTLIASNFVNAKIVIVPELWDATFMDSDYLSTISLIKQAICDFSNKIIMIDDAYTWMSGRFSHLIYDSGIGMTVHPDVYGHRVIANHLYGAVMGQPYRANGYIKFASGFCAGIDAANSAIEIIKQNGEVRIRPYFKVSDASAIPANRVIFQTVLPINAIPDFFTGDQLIWINYNRRVQGAGELLGAWQCTVTQTDQSTGSITLTLTAYQGTPVNGNTYYQEIIIPEGVKYTDAQFG